LAPSTLHTARVSTASQTFWCYKRGLLVLKLSSAPGVFAPTNSASGTPVPCGFASGQFMSIEWEPRVLVLLERANDLVEFIELLEDRRYQVAVEAPSMKVMPLRFL
jgi:hypothetical protein